MKIPESLAKLVQEQPKAIQREIVKGLDAIVANPAIGTYAGYPYQAHYLRHTTEHVLIMYRVVDDDPEILALNRIPSIEEIRERLRDLL